MEYLIANSGIHFISNEVEFNPDEPLILPPNQRPLKYSFCEEFDELLNQLRFNILINRQGSYFSIEDLQVDHNIANGAVLDETGLPVIDENNFNANLYTAYGANDIYTINNLTGYCININNNGNIQQCSAFDILTGKWLPMPMFEQEINGVSNDTPVGWCRFKIEKLGDGARPGTFKYKIIWAFDTTLSNNMVSHNKPYFFEEDGDFKKFSLCNRTDLLTSFHFVTNANGTQVSPISEYLAGLLQIGQANPGASHFKYIAYYIYFVNYIRLAGYSPEITLCKSAHKPIPVDMVLDIGNSRTCGVLFENGDFTKAKMLELRDLTSPWKSYDKPFDMRIVFRKADFGNNLILDHEEDESEPFTWKSLVRVGEEAGSLICHSKASIGLSQRMTNYSSPKRYLWDTQAFNGEWFNLTTEKDPLNVAIDDSIYVQGITDWFNQDGTFTGEANNQFHGNHFSRSSLMTLVLIEILQHAIVQINSIKFRNQHGSLDQRRVLRNLILTCPTAMPLVEQIKLRQSAQDAYKVIMGLNPTLNHITISPSVQALQINGGLRRDWSYDEASSCQFVYLYAEMVKRYNGDTESFIKAKGHVRPELQAEGYNAPSLTIGSIDIGAGTTDIMICTYKYENNQNQVRASLTPIPQFWDSFYLAGDDILRNIVQTVVIDGTMKNEPHLGCIHSALEARLLNMTNEQLLALPIYNANAVYRATIDNIVRNDDNTTREGSIKSLASNLIHDYFGYDSNMMSYLDRQYRADFNVQISVPIAQKMMELLRLHSPSRVYSFDELFPYEQPSSYILDHFYQHFGFRLEELSWRFDPTEIAGLIRSTMETLLKHLSILLFEYQCDILLLSGRPTSIDEITELFIKSYPISPDRLVRLNGYRVGSWYPFADGEGYFYDQKSVVAVGAMIGNLASHRGFNGLVLNFERMINTMKSTANYMGLFDSKRRQVDNSILTPTQANATLTIAVFPTFIGCKQFNAPVYQARPIYAIYNNTQERQLIVSLSRSYIDNKEELHVEEVCDAQHNTLPQDSIRLVQQSLVDDGSYWLDKGEFELSLQ